MHVSALTLALATLAAAAVVPDPYVGNFRSFGQKGCYEENLGVWTVTQTGVTGGECNDFNGFTIRSLQNTRIVDGYTMYLYSDDACKDGVVIPKGECKDAEGEWKRWKIVKDA
jgi:hypothetical protein